jgi:ABC-type Fe3+-siderophore transport system permease subunit
MLEITGEVSAAAAALAGLALVFFGASVSSFDAFAEDQKDAVRWIYRRRAWPAFIALIAAILSCGVSLYAKALHSEVAAEWGIGLLALVGVAIFISALLAVLEIG